MHRGDVWYTLRICNRICIHGSCYEDPTSTRQFSCHCRLFFYGRNCEHQRTVLEANVMFVVENSHIVVPIASVISTIFILFMVYFACLNRRKLPEERKAVEHPLSIRERKIKVALEQNKNIIRRKKDYNRLMALTAKLKRKSKVELGAVTAI
ncbi:unnamed protein product [Cylicocyclus nassatus]|uniref:EGF-like domain-containing protein n=1 Tax=Cylicocyclus nassatus TaxID=53992 RepID=A0AA36H5S2_CYLNA|nr:unnamed protein product [Cylicocyclus nassatus]